MYRDPGARPVEKLKRRTPMVLRVAAFVAGATLTLVFGSGCIAMLAAARLGNLAELGLALLIALFCLAIGLYGVDLMWRAITVRSTDAPALQQKRFGRLRIAGALFVGLCIAVPSFGALAFGHERGGDAILFLSTLALGGTITALAIRAIMLRTRARERVDATLADVAPAAARVDAVPGPPTRIAVPSSEEEDDGEVVAQRRVLRRTDE